MSLSTGVRQEYNGIIAAMRSSGATLREIGEHCSVSGQRVSQILKRHYKGVKPRIVSQTTLAKILGSSPAYVSILVKKSIIVSQPHGKSYYHFSAAEILKALSYCHKPCIHCGKPKPSKNSRYCNACSLERRRYNYPFLNKGVQVRMRKASCAWLKRNPDKAKLIQARAGKKYYDKKKSVLDE